MQTSDFQIIAVPGKYVDLFGRGERAYYMVGK